MLGGAAFHMEKPSKSTSHVSLVTPAEQACRAWQVQVREELLEGAWQRSHGRRCLLVDCGCGVTHHAAVAPGLHTACGTGQSYWPCIVTHGTCWQAPGAGSVGHKVVGCMHLRLLAHIQSLPGKTQHVQAHHEVLLPLAPAFMPHWHAAASLACGCHPPSSSASLQVFSSVYTKSLI